MKMIIMQKITDNTAKNNTDHKKYERFKAIADKNQNFSKINDNIHKGNYFNYYNFNIQFIYVIYYLFYLLFILFFYYLINIIYYYLLFII